MGWTTQFFYSQLFLTPPYPTSSFASQTVIVTGSNTGLGLEAARHFVRLGASKVILGVRTVSKGEKARESILASEGADPSTVEVWALDQSSSASVKAFAERARALERLDAVVLNAGILTQQFTPAEGGHESTILVNLVNTVLLGFMLLPTMRESARRTGLAGRITFVGSDLHMRAKFKEQFTEGRIFDALKQKEGADMGDRYAASKLLLMYAVRDLAARSPLSAQSNVIISYVSPGLCYSEIMRDKSWVTEMVVGLVSSVLARKTEVGSRAYIDAVRPGQTETHGKFLWNCRVSESGAVVDSEQGRKNQEKCMKELREILEEIQPGVTRI